MIASVTPRKTRYGNALLRNLTVIEVLLNYHKLICSTQNANKLFNSSGLLLMFEPLNVKKMLSNVDYISSMSKMSPC